MQVDVSSRNKAIEFVHSTGPAVQAVLNCCTRSRDMDAVKPLSFDWFYVAGCANQVGLDHLNKPAGAAGAKWPWLHDLHPGVIAVDNTAGFRQANRFAEPVPAGNVELARH